MPRSRSRSRSRIRDDRVSERRRSRSRERERRREKYRPSRRSRSRSPRARSPRRRSRDRTPNDEKRSRELIRAGSENMDLDDESSNHSGALSKPITAEDLVEVAEDEKKMLELMGFGSFDTTKGKKVAGNDHYAVHIVRKRRYRQYMNRRGGFNRPLDFIA